MDEIAVRFDNGRLVVANGIVDHLESFVLFDAWEEPKPTIVVYKCKFYRVKRELDTFGYYDPQQDDIVSVDLNILQKLPHFRAVKRSFKGGSYYGYACASFDTHAEDKQT